MLVLPWPSPILNPNNRCHYMKKANARAKQRLDCFYLAKYIPIPLFVEGNIQITMIFHPPTKRHVDWDNMVASCKGMLDGVADAWNINDCRFRPITIDFGDVFKHGKVVISWSQK